MPTAAPSVERVTSVGPLVNVLRLNTEFIITTMTSYFTRFNWPTKFLLQNPTRHPNCLTTTNILLWPSSTLYKFARKICPHTTPPVPV